MRILWRSQEPEREKKQRRIQINLRMVIIILGVLIIIASCIFAILFSQMYLFLSILGTIATIVAAIPVIRGELFSPISLQKTQNKESIVPLASDTTPPAIEQPSQNTSTDASSTRPLEGEAVSVRQPSQKAPAYGSSTQSPGGDVGPMSGPSASVETGPLTTSDSFSNPEGTFHFNERLSNANDFYGRKEDIRILIDRSKKGLSTSIVGPSGIGKTWLVQYLQFIPKHEINTNVRIGYLDARLPTCTTIEDFTRKAIRALNTSTDNAHPNLAVLEEVVESLVENKQCPILCIDKFEKFADQPIFNLAFFDQLRGIAAAGLALILVSKKPLTKIVSEESLTSPLFNLFAQRDLEPLSKEEAEEFVTAKSKEAAFIAQEQEKLLHYGKARTEGWLPARLQLVGEMLLEDKIHHADTYQPDNEDYWRRFEQRINARCPETEL